VLPIGPARDQGGREECAKEKRKVASKKHDKKSAPGKRGAPSPGNKQRRPSPAGQTGFHEGWWGPANEPGEGAKIA